MSTNRVQQDAQSKPEPYPLYTTVRVAGMTEADEEYHIECRMSDGQKGAFVRVDIEFEQLAHRISEYLNGTRPTATYDDKFTSLTPLQQYEVLKAQVVEARRIRDHLRPDVIDGQPDVQGLPEKKRIHKAYVEHLEQQLADLLLKLG